MCQLEDLPDFGRQPAKFQITAFSACRLKQPHHGAEAAAVEEIYFLQLQNYVAVFVDCILHPRVESEDFVSGDNAPVALHNEDFSNRPAFELALQSPSVELAGMVLQ